MISHKNKYGLIEFDVCQYQQVGTISSKNIADEFFFDVDTAEKVALVTEDLRTQLSVSIHPGKMFLIHHTDSDVAAVCKITKLEFNKDFNAREILARPNVTQF